MGKAVPTNQIRRTTVLKFGDSSFVMMLTIRKTTIRNLLLLYGSCLVLLSVLPVNGSHSSLNHNYILSIRWDYLAHVAMMSAMGLLVMLCVSTRQSTIKSLLRALILTFSFAVALEALQFLIPYRSFNINDLASNGIGVVLGALSFFLIKRLVK